MELNFKMYGDSLNEPIIIIHGLFGSLDNWQTVAKLLAENYLVYVLDMRNHGKSAHDLVFNYQIMAADVAQFIDEYSLRQPHLIGHSMGGKVAMELALNYTNYIDKLIVVDIAPKIYAAHHQEVFKAMFGLNPTALKSRNEAEQILNNYELDWATKQFILKNLSINKLGNGYQWQVNLEAIHHNYEHILAHNYSNKKYNGQTLFIKGGLSDYINIAEFENYKQYFPKAELQIIENAGHWVHSDKPAELIKAVLQHLNK